MHRETGESRVMRSAQRFVNNHFATCTEDPVSGDLVRRSCEELGPHRRTVEFSASMDLYLSQTSKDPWTQSFFVVGN